MDTNTQEDIQALTQQVASIQNQLDTLSAQFYKNNFTSHQDFTKGSNFTTKLKIPSYSSLPTCEVGEIAQVGGVAYICSATNTWTVIGSQ